MCSLLSLATLHKAAAEVMIHCSTSMVLKDMLLFSEKMHEHALKANCKGILKPIRTDIMTLYGLHI